MEYFTRRTWPAFRRCVGWLLRWGKMPQHVAFIMDGNRRFAKREKLSKIEGHQEGYRKLVEIVRWCIDFGIPYMSVYAFSIENFKRSAEEVTALMDLAEKKYRELMEENGLANEVGLVIKVLGDLSLAPEGVQKAAADIMRHCETLKTKKSTLNICFSYTASQETSQAVGSIQDAIQNGHLEPSDVDPWLIERSLFTSTAPPVDLLVRTSGETRLSDFLLWQCRNACLVFTDVLWPEYSFSNFVSTILEFQDNYGHWAEIAGQIRVCDTNGGNGAVRSEHSGKGQNCEWTSLKEKSEDGYGVSVTCGSRINSKEDLADTATSLHKRQPQLHNGDASKVHVIQNGKKGNKANREQPVKLQASEHRVDAFLSNREQNLVDWINCRSKCSDD